MIFDSAHIWLRDKIARYFPDDEITYHFPFVIGFTLHIILKAIAIILAVIILFLFALGQLEILAGEVLLKIFTTKMFYSIDDKAEIKKWCKENCRYYLILNRNYGKYYAIAFFRKSDATHYKLTWK